MKKPNGINFIEENPNADLFEHIYKKSKSRASFHDMKDVRIALHSAQNGSKTGFERVAFTFNNDLSTLITDGHKHIAIAILKNRIYFLPTNDQSIGYTATSYASGRSQFRLTPSDENERKVFKNFIGDYDLKFNNERDLYYIEKKEEANGRI